jgi:hypothetical protein
MAMTMIRDILKETGITSTVGIGTNLYLAKVAMDIQAKKMPADKDGVRIAELNEDSYCYLLWIHTPLTDELNEKLTLPHSLTCNGKAARKNRPQVTVTCFVPCSDAHNDWYNRGGQYIAITGTVKKVDCSAILIDDMMIALEDIAGIDMCDVNT